MTKFTKVEPIVYPTDNRVEEKNEEKNDNNVSNDSGAGDNSKPTTQQLIRQECDRIKKLLLEKNRKYGDSAINPVRIFSKADNLEQLRVRIDDKLSRLISGQEDEDEDVINDLIGYMVLLLVGRRG